MAAKQADVIVKFIDVAQVCTVVCRVHTVT